jgi:steroid delta-isomerase-like uncharacterized protein
MSTQLNKEVVRRAYTELVNEGNYENIEDICHEDYFDHTQPPGWPTDREGLRQQLLYFRTAFPDINVTFEAIIAEDDVVMLRQTMRGTHLGEFFGIPPTGKQVAMTGMHLFRILDGRLVEHQANNDDLGLLRQLGAIPAPVTETSVVGNGQTAGVSSSA